MLSQDESRALVNKPFTVQPQLRLDKTNLQNVVNQLPSDGKWRATRELENQALPLSKIRLLGDEAVSFSCIKKTSMRTNEIVTTRFEV